MLLQGTTAIQVSNKTGNKESAFKGVLPFKLFVRLFCFPGKTVVLRLRHINPFSTVHSMIFKKKKKEVTSLLKSPLLIICT